MNVIELQRKLIAAAKSRPCADTVPYAFEKRIMARLPMRAGSEALAVWAAVLWRGAALCLAIVLLLGAWSLFAPVNNATADLSQELENTLLAGGEQDATAVSSW